jgi:hypothetical protein
MIMSLGLLAQPPGPLDGFRANFAALRCEVEYTYATHQAGGGVLTAMRAWAPGVGPALDSIQEVAGTWATDGRNEHYVLRNSKPVEPPKDRRAVPLLLPYAVEVLRDGDAISYLDRDAPAEGVQFLTDSRSPVRLIGPFAWTGGDSFPAWLLTDFPGVRPDLRRALFSGSPVDVEVYRRTYPEGEGTSRVDVCYDPSVGYVPRYARGVTISSDQTGYVKEALMIEARPAPGGGFVTTEWVVASYEVRDFPARYPDHDTSVVFEPTGRVMLGHFKASVVRPRPGAVGLLPAREPRAVYGAGGRAILAPGAVPITMADLKKALRNKLTKRPGPTLGHIDEDALAEANGRPAPPWPRWYWAMPLASAVVVGAWWFRRRAALALLLCGPLPVLAAGCSGSTAETPPLTVSFSETRLLYEANTTAIPLSLIIRNPSSRPVRLIDVDGGCTCRKVDTSSLPTTIQRMDEVELKVSVQKPASHEAESYTFRVTTDQGVLARSAVLRALPRHQLSPSEVSLNVLDSDSPVFEVAHREIFKDGPTSSLRLVCPSGQFKLETVSSERGRVRDTKDLSWVDTIYRVSLIDTTLGLHRDMLSLRKSEEGPLLDCPIVWQRAPYLGSLPDRVVLGAYPVRVFLRCPDDAIEWTKILRVPAAVRAVVSSPREVTVSLTPDAPAIVDDMVEVGTTAADRPPVRIPVVRYGPVIASD